MIKIILFIAISFFIISCNNDDDLRCEFYYTGLTKVEYNSFLNKMEFFVSYTNDIKSGTYKYLKVHEDTYNWILKENIREGSCFDVRKHEID